MKAHHTSARRAPRTGRVSRRPAGGDLADGDEQAEEGEHVDAGPFHRAREAAQDAGCEQPGAVARVGSDGEAAAVAHEEEGAQVSPSRARRGDLVPFAQCAHQARTGVLLVLDDAEEGGEREHREEAVEDGRAAHDDCLAVGGQEEPRDERERRVVEEVVREAAQE